MEASSTDGSVRTNFGTGAAVKRILIVDDNREAAETLAKLLLIMGHDSAVCFDGLAAIEHAKQNRPVLVFLDIVLPGFSGFQTARAVQRLPGDGHMYLVALTGWTDEECERKAYSAGFDTFVAKPMGMKTLHRVLAVSGIEADELAAV
jgi:CheY-like chemotaxis protein